MTRPAERFDSSCETAPPATISGAAFTAGVLAITSSASAVRKNVGDETTVSVAPSRPSAICFRLSRTDAPTSSAPASTATATATPSTTKALVAA